MPKKMSNVTKQQFLGSGANGCALKPAAACNDSDIVGDNTVSKIFKKKWLAEDEIAIHDYVIKTVDPKGVFTLNKVNNCSVDLSKFNKTELDKCPPAIASAGSGYQIIYEYGGGEIGDNNVPFADIFFAAWRVFDGLVLLTDAKFVHQDIKPANVLYEPVGKRMTLIDFGLALPLRSIYDQDNINILSYAYEYFPPEYNVFAYTHDEKNDNIMANINALYGRIHVVQQASGKQWGAEMLALMNEQIKEYNMFWTGGVVDSNTEVHVEDLKIEKRMTAWSRHGSKVDVYSFGVTLLETLCGANDVDDIQDPFIVDVLNLVKNMICFNPVKRFTPRKANVQYKQIVKRWISRTTNVAK